MKDIALVYMPWGAVSKPSIALGILKQCAKEAGFTADVFYFNLDFAESVGVQLYENISSTSAFYPEWFFSNYLFGADGLGLLKNSWSDLQETEDGRSMIRELIGLAGNSEDLCTTILAKASGFIENCLNKIDWGSYRAVGFSVTFAQTMASLCLAYKIKQKFPSLRMIFGGANVDAEMGLELLRGCEWIDCIVHGEAEAVFGRLLATIQQEKPPDIPGISYRFEGNVVSGAATARPLLEMDSSPFPDYSDYFQESARRKLDRSVKLALPIESSRGCWWGAKHHCTFCGLNGVTMGFRKKSWKRVYDEIMEMAKSYRCLSFNAVDNILDMGYFHELLPALASADIDLTLFYEVKANLSRQQLQMLAEAGIKKVQPGIESFSSELLQKMRKGVTAIQNIQFLKWCREFGIDPLWNLLFGFPGETAEHYAEYPDLMRLLFHLKPPTGVFPVVFERFSPYHFDRDRFKLKIRHLTKYRLLYPEDRIALENVAYYFEGEWQGQEQCPEEYIQPVQNMQQEWRGYWQTNSVSFYFEKGPNFLVLYDSRPLPQDKQIKVRRTVLNALQSRIYQFCDANRSFRAIYELVTEINPLMTAEQTRTLLDNFVTQRLMFRENDRYLSLATRQAHKAAQSFGTDSVCVSDAVPDPSMPLNGPMPVEHL
ncbi:MAG TPA: RiPP maturation radical SAM C-methyltransferase [Candidatus Angelobacter sp.]|nr:RiPP maturation radical SAM C-methyltransferase [Candidatus Angelobacter sp.]